MFLLLLLLLLLLSSMLSWLFLLMVSLTLPLLWLVVVAVIVVEAEMLRSGHLRCVDFRANAAASAAVDRSLGQRRRRSLCRRVCLRSLEARDVRAQAHAVGIGSSRNTTDLTATIGR